MKNIFSTLAALICFFSTYAQLSHRTIDWHSGTLVLRSGLEMNGEVAYDPLTEVVQFKNVGMIKAFTSHQVQSFHFTEEKFGLMREFATYETKAGSRLTRQRFFEVVLRGPLTVVRKNDNPRESTTSSQVANQPGLAYFDYERNFIYYVYHNGQFVNLKRFTKAVLPLMDEYKQELRKYDRQRDINPKSDIAYQIRVINEYNYLKSSTRITKLN